MDDCSKIAGAYRTVHPGKPKKKMGHARERNCSVDTPINNIGPMTGNKVWLPEMSRALALRGAQIIVYPCDWDRKEAEIMAAVETEEEHRAHLFSCIRTDNVARFGSQIVVTDRYRPGQCITLMCYPTVASRRTSSTSWT